MSKSIKTILYATDINEGSSVVFQAALNLAKQYQAKLLFLHVVEPLGTTAAAAVSIYFPSGSLEEFYKQSMDEAYKNINMKMESLYKKKLEDELPGEQFQSYILEGIPAVTIIKTAEKMDADIIVLGSNSHSTLDNFLVGSVANKVINRSSKPVLLVPVKSHSSEG